MAQIAIIGGGLLGRVLAWQLAEQGVACSVFCQGSPEGRESAAYQAAAMLAPAAEAAECAPLLTALGRQSLPLWGDMVARLPETVFFQQNGTLVLWHAQDRALAVQFERHLKRAGIAPERWQRDDIATREAQLGQRFAQGFYLAEDGQLDGRQLLGVLARALAERGVACHWYTPCTPASVQGQFDWVVDCRGMGAQSDWNAAGATLLRGVRGEVARVYAPEVSLQRPVRLLHPRYPLYIAPKPQQWFVVGATQIESEDTGAATVRSGLELLSALYTLDPAFGEAKLCELSAALRPTLTHQRPEIRFSCRRRMLAVNGLFRHGFMIAPALADSVCRLLTALLDGKPIPAHDAISGLDYHNYDEYKGNKQWIL